MTGVNRPMKERNDMNFVYVFSKQDRDKLLSLGYVLLKEDYMNNVYVFINNNFSSFQKLPVKKYSFSSVLTF